MDDWRDRFILSSSLRIPAERAALYRSAARGEFTRATRGVYVRTDYWKGLTIEGRHLARMRAAALLRPGLVFSHLSAALAWGLPVIGGDLAIPHSVGAYLGGGRSRTGLRHHSLGLPTDVHEIDGLRVTAPDLTAVHIAMAYAAEMSVPVLDHGLGQAWMTREGLLARLAQLPHASGAVRAEWAIGFADPSSGSPGESLSRVGIRRLGLPAPELQVPFHDGRGLIGVVDFYWPDHELIGEFDGIGKYLRAEFTDGRGPGEVVIAEKVREDRLRAQGPRVARWGWDTARDRAALRRVLSEAGLRSA